MRVKSLIPPALVAIAIGALALSLGHTRAGSGRPQRPVVASGHLARLVISNYAFHPPTLIVRAGTTITVTNTDATSHTATARSGAFDSGTLKPGQQARFTLSKPGVYSYYCQFHAFMTGTIKVVR